MSSPVKKRMKYDPKTREQLETPNIIERRLRSEERVDLDRLAAMRRKNFVTACEKVSYEAYLDRQKRLQIFSLPACARNECNHLSNHETIIEMPSYATESFNIEIKTGMWYDALEVCQVSISYDQYLSADVMKDIIEIIMNAHDDSYVNYTVEELIDKCQQVLAVNFSTHPPCPETLRSCYKNFLTTPMDLRDNTFTNRKEYGCSQGIVKYCMNRLEADIKAGGNDDPIVNKYENTPFEMKEGVQGLHWEKEKFEIFELLERPERIKRLMAVLESIIELLQYDLAIWQSRHTRNMGRHIMNLRKRPLLAVLLWPTTPVNTGGFNNCRQIVDLFIYVIHLRYPEEHIQIMTTWLNTLAQIFYVCETNANSNYPNIGTYCNSFATRFYERVTEKGLSNDSVISILERIQPSFMRYLIGMHATTSFLELKVKEDNVIKVLIDFITKQQWKDYPESDNDIQASKAQFSSCDNDNMYETLLSTMEQWKLEEMNPSDNNNNDFPNFLRPESLQQVTQDHVVHVLYITVEAYLDTYSVITVQDTLDDLNKKLLEPNTQPVHINLPKPGIYSVSEDYIKNYRTIFVKLQELLRLKQQGEWPQALDLLINVSVLR